MTAELLQILREYQRFEAAVRQQIATFCDPHCSVCDTVCCRPEYCRENLDSPFLSLVSSKTPPKSDYCAARGWLTSTGCALSAGRPPVCYQFNCSPIIAALTNDQQRYFMRVLSNLIPHLGMRALGDRHLVEILDAAQLKRIKITRFRKRLAEALRAFQIIQSNNGDEIPSASMMEDLSKIAPIPKQFSAKRAKLAEILNP